uniref:SMP-30/Gluconolactonase/LRE-like region domain-containing protein n=1 Tax=Tetradesmus obliquus TaxID=3088 RepID=A0A383VB41_TETOB|eukprot:jgi/Sobl393_1/8462/SZX62778.1
MWTTNGREVWVAVRGEDYLQVLDGATYKPTRRIQVPNGPGMTIISSDGKYAYVCSTFTPETVVIDTASYEVVKRIKQASTFCPNIAATPDGSQVWFTLKDSGKVQVFSAQPPFNSIAVLETGAITNHVNFALTPKGQFAYVTIGGLRQVKVFTTGPQPKLVATIDTGDNPHGLWPSGDGSRMYVGLQLSNAVAVIDTASNRVLSTVDVGAQAPMALMYVPRAVPDSSSSSSSSSATANLVPAEEARKAASALHFGLVATASGKVSSSSSSSKAPGKQAVLSSVAVNSQGPFSDSLEAAFSGLKPGQQYVLALAKKKDGSGDVEPLASFTAGPDGAAGAAVLGPFRGMLLGGQKDSAAGKRQARYLTVALLSGSGDAMKVGSPVQVQQ